MEDQAYFDNVEEMDDYIEEFLLEINKAKEGHVLDNAKEGVNVNLQKDVRLEQQAELKESSNASLSVKYNQNSKLVLRNEGDENATLDSSSEHLKVATGTVITSEDQQRSESIMVEELIEVEKR